MAQYKVLQDIEAEDKLLGPLSLRQFLYAVIAIVCGFIAFRLFVIYPLLGIPMLPPTILFFVLAAPFGREQPSEVWLLAKIRFFLKPRRRIWDQAGLQELVTVTAPKKIQRQLTDGLSQTEVRSRLKALADTIDTRGWAIKGMDLNMANNPVYYRQSTDRLFDVNALMPATNPNADVPLENDPMAAFNPIAQQFDQMVAASGQSHRQQIMDRMQQIRDQQQQAPVPPPAPTAQPQYAPAITQTPQQVAQQPQNDVASYQLPPQVDAHQAQQAAYGNTHILQRVAPPAPTPPPATIPPVTEPNQAVKIELAKNNDLNVATIAREVNKGDEPQDEVVISLR